MTQLSLRPATQKDYDFLWWLHRATMRQYVEKTWGWDEAWQSQFFQEHFDPTTREIVESNGVPIGCITVERSEGLIFLAAIEIAPDYQNRGIGTKLIRALLDEANDRGVSVELSVLKVNPARRLYERLGFAIVGETETHYLMRWRPANAAEPGHAADAQEAARD
jgi:ribosomal protein S18 acetylase RimI-like enzyme